MKIAVGTLKDQREELAAFLEPRLGAKPEVTGDSLEVEDGAVRAGVKPRDVKTYIKRFMYMKGVRKKYRVFVAGKELTIQEIEQGEKEEEEEKESQKEGQQKPPEEAPEARPSEKGASESGKQGGGEETKEEKPAKKAPKKQKPKKPAKTTEEADDRKGAEGSETTGSAPSS